PQLSLPSLPSSFITVKKHLPKEQVHFVLGNLGTTLYNEDRYPMAVLDAILSGQGGRLFINLRDKKGLAYALTFVHREGIEPGIWAVYMATSPDKLDEALKGVKEEIRRLREKGVEDEEIERAKQYIIGNFVIGLQTNTQQALSMALNERYGLGYNYDEIYQKRIKKVKKSEIIKVIQSYLHEKNCVLSLVGPVK
ncbi:MAG TPA: insulinase family protein, partial [Candidatus Desulfofervidus auxilii]|nr:insulinase family protein [Candidatus Desulfofervidus auxilii]